MTEPIKPALTDEQWERIRRGLLVDENDARLYAAPLGDEREELSELQQAAALLNVAGPNRSPLFTHADVEVIRHALLGWDGMGDPGDGTTDWVSPRYPNADTLADRLESLLPPREP